MKFVVENNPAIKQLAEDILRGGVPEGLSMGEVVSALARCYAAVAMARPMTLENATELLALNWLDMTTSSSKN